MSRKEVFQFNLEPEQLDALRAVSAASGRPAGAIVRQALVEWMERQKARGAARFRPKRVAGKQQQKAAGAA